MLLDPVILIVGLNQNSIVNYERSLARVSETSEIEVLFVMFMF